MALRKSHRRTLETIRAVNLGFAKEPPNWLEIKRLLAAIGIWFDGEDYHFRAIYDPEKGDCGGEAVRIAILGGPKSVSVPSKFEVTCVYDFLESIGCYDGI